MLEQGFNVIMSEYEDFALKELVGGMVFNYNNTSGPEHLMARMGLYETFVIYTSPRKVHFHIKK